MYLAKIKPRLRGGDPLPEWLTVVELSLGPGTGTLPRHHPPRGGAAWSDRIRHWTANRSRLLLLLLMWPLRHPEHILGATDKPEVRFIHILFLDNFQGTPGWDFRTKTFLETGGRQASGRRPRGALSSNLCPEWCLR